MSKIRSYCSWGSHRARTWLLICSHWGLQPASGQPSFTEQYRVNQHRHLRSRLWHYTEPAHQLPDEGWLCQRKTPNRLVPSIHGCTDPRANQNRKKNNVWRFVQRILLVFLLLFNQIWLKIVRIFTTNWTNLKRVIS